MFNNILFANLYLKSKLKIFFIKYIKIIDIALIKKYIINIFIFIIKFS